MADVYPAPPPPTMSASGPLPSVGIIYPPADLRGIIDKTAQFVAKNGPEFESRVMKEQNNQRFAFLAATNPYRAYYDMKIDEFKSGTEQQSQPIIPQAILDMRQQEEEKTRKKAQLLALTEYAEKSRLQPPEPDQYSVVHPYIAPVDSDVVKVTAQFVARNGQKFLSGLSQREKNNPQFEFLKPSHALFAYFTNLVDSYSKCLIPPPEQLEKLKNIISNRSIPLKMAYARYQWESEEEIKRRERDDAAAEERAQMASIDWHDFIVIETINFTAEDDDLPLDAPMDFTSTKPVPAPSSLASLSTAPTSETVMDIEGSAPTGTTSTASSNTISDASLQTPLQILPEMPPTIHAQQTATVVQNFSTSYDEPIKVVKGYVRVPKRRQLEGPKMQKCPITGQMIPAEDMTQHLRILLLDPKWKKQKDQLLERAKQESAFAALHDVEGNLASFVTRRPDIFGSVDDEALEQTETLGLEKNYALSASSVPVSTNPSDSLSNIVHPPAVLPVTPTPYQNILRQGVMYPANVVLPMWPAQAPGMVPYMPQPASHLMMVPPVQESMEENPVKKIKTAPDAAEDKLYSESYFISLNKAPVDYSVTIFPGDANEKNLNLSVDVRMTIQGFKEMLLREHLSENSAITANKLKVKDVKNGAILKEDNTFAFYNLGSETQLDVFLKQRGGTKAVQ